jgi:hypothetical protein
MYAHDPGPSDGATADGSQPHDVGSPFATFIKAAIVIWPVPQVARFQMVFSR